MLVWNIFFTVHSTIGTDFYFEIMASVYRTVNLTLAVLFLFSWILLPVSSTPMMPLSWKLPPLLTFGSAKEPAMLRNQEHKSCWRYWEFAPCRLLRAESQVRWRPWWFLCSCTFAVIISRIFSFVSPNKEMWTWAQRGFSKVSSLCLTAHSCL